MWFDEVERIGMRRCTPIGYRMRGIGELAAFAGLLLLVGVPVYLAYRAVAGTFSWSMLWLLTAPFVVRIVGVAFLATSRLLAGRRQFRYDYERRASSWIERGEARNYTYADWQAEQGRAG